MTEIDYAIVGGGVAGTYCAWRLQKEYREKKKIELFEYSDRIGGRLLTLKPEEFDVVDAIRKKGGIDVNAELGGMRYLPDEHKIFVKVIEELKLKSKSFPMGDDYENRNGENNIVYLRHTHLRMKELRDPEKVPYPKLAWLEKGLDPDQLQYYVMKSYVPDYQNLEGPEQWGNVEIFGKKLYQFGFWNLLYRVLSPEAYTFLKYGSGYDTNVSNGNAAVLLPTGEEFSPEPSPNVDSTEKPEKPPPTKFRTLEDGLQALPLKLAEEFEKNKGILHRNHRLHSIEKANGKYKLRFFKTETAIGKDGRYTTVDVEPVDDVLAENVILAMPRTALELIEWDQWKENDFLKKYLSSVINQPAIKILLAYDYAWWKSLGMVYGRSITDLPIRQTLYFTSQYDTDLNKISKKPALLLASYNDIETIPFWKALEYAEEDDLFPGPEGYQASKEMVKEANDQIEEMHDYEEMLKPIAAAFFDWSQKPFGAGWHCWKANIKFWEVADQMRHPVDTEKVYICGDAYSYDQGWAEGALETAELVLTKNLEEPLESILEEPLESISEKQYMPKKMKRRR